MYEPGIGVAVANAVGEVDEKASGHAVDGGGESLVVNVASERADGALHLFETQRRANVVNEVGERAVRQRPSQHTTHHTTQQSLDWIRLD